MANKGNKNVKVVIQRPRLPSHVSLFTSLSIIVLAFFILLNAFSTYDDKRTLQAIDSIQLEFLGIFQRSMQRFSIFDADDSAATITAENAATPGKELLFQLLRTVYTEYSALGEFAELNGMRGVLGTLVTQRGMVITVGEELTFEAASAELSEIGRQFLDRLTRIVKPFKNDIIVEGHTDDSPPASPYNNNWELSQARAMSVLRYMNENGVQAERLSASGAGQFRPLAPNDSEENRARNRRVEIIIKHPRLRTTLFGN